MKKKSEQRIWYVIPARGGSKGIPKKNVRLLGNKPLIRHLIDTISSFSTSEHIIVSTDNEEIKTIVKGSCKIHHRSDNNSSDKATLDDVIFEVTQFLVNENGAEDHDIVVTCQPTSPFTSRYTLEKIIEITQSQTFDTVITLKDDRHLRWGLKENDILHPLYQKRVNRQLMPPTFSETGGVVSTTVKQILSSGTRIAKNIGGYIVDEKEGLDIDSSSDWALAEYWINRLKIFVRVDGSKNIGFGHLYRALALAQSVNLHEISFYSRNDEENLNGFDFLKSHHYSVHAVNSNLEFSELISECQPDIVINDILDTDTNYMKALKENGVFIVNFEDLGDGNKMADIVINDLYPDLNPNLNHWYGLNNAIINPCFEYVLPKSIINKDVNHIVITYGGTDPCNLTEKALKALSQINFSGRISAIVGPGNENFKNIESLIQKLPNNSVIYHNVINMADLLSQADLALTSAGRTVTELITLGIPTITMCQNTREMRHNHATSEYGVINLGLGSSVNIDVLGEHIKLLINDFNLRSDMNKRMLNSVKNRNNQSIVNKIITEFQKTKNGNQ